ncbi:MAG TPA: MGMT family protein [Holophagaceae bacterium]|nr:MGMT family protein [Holophagaceae bacterium]
MIPTALGPVALGWSASGFTGLRFVDAPLHEPVDAPGWVGKGIAAIQAHLAGEASDPARLPVDLRGLTPFQRRVADVLRASGPGQLLSYGEVALLLGKPGAARAVGQAVKANPLLLLVPCHRVVGARGPGGWSAFGSPGIKARLLELERPDNGGDDAPAAR